MAVRSLFSLQHFEFEAHVLDLMSLHFGVKQLVVQRYLEVQVLELVVEVRVLRLALTFSHCFLDLLRQGLELVAAQKEVGVFLVVPIADRDLAACFRDFSVEG